MRLDSHQHFWRYLPGEYPWIEPGWPIRRDCLPADLEPALRACGVEGTVAVQARQSLIESRWLLELAQATPWIKGVVGWVDLCSPDVGAQLASLAADAKFVGVRHVVQDEPDERFMLRKEFQRGIAQLRAFGLTYDLLIFSQQLPAAIELVQAFPEQPFVLDHLAKPRIRDRALSPWLEQFRLLGQAPNVMCKLSGLVTEASWGAWQPGDFRPYLDAAFEAFGPERLMFGSDWPVALLSASYQQVYQLVGEYVCGLGEKATAQVFGLNATRFYNV